ncbi:UNVERIFIED_CONTAM: hypothetical protein PYX00_008182 [Menopon gallinae]|uniref:NudC domain-containing protein 1 n=1 Tax=Menopon gallinae TaxID=328185 RepID=A0AAW2HM94_9NEOP
MSKNSFLVDLRPNRNLLDPNFSGYKLSLDSVPIYKKQVTQGVDSIQPNDDQFSFAHVKLFSLQNHLHVNPFTNCVYFVDKRWNVTKIVINLLNKLEDLETVWEIPPLQGDKKRLYNISMAFATSDLLVLSDGAGTAYLLSVRTIGNSERWEIITSFTLCDSGFLISSVQLEKFNTNELLHIVFMHVDQKEDKAKEIITTGFFHTIVEWVTLTKGQEEGPWIKKSHRKLEVDGNVEYIALEPGCKAVYIVGDKPPKWTYDTNNIDTAETENKEETGSEPKLYSWSQNEEEITIWVPTDDIKKHDLNINVDEKTLEVKIKGEVVIAGDFFNRIDKDLTSWSIEKDKLEIQLIKREVGLMWQDLILNDNRGEQIYNPEVVGRVHEQLAHLCSDKEVDPGQPSFNSQQLEECDAMSCDTVVCVRMSAETHSASHEVSLSSFQWLFKVHCDPEKAPAICLRHDVDACVWQFENTQDSEKEWPYKHIGSFFAFGYVQASKNQKKYLTCPPDLSYATVCETTRHIYIYRQPSAVTGELRNRTSGKKVETVSKQQLINLETNEQILGVFATNSLLYVLTENIVHVLTVNE